jgi:hypothetical protein
MNRRSKLLTSSLTATLLFVAGCAVSSPEQGALTASNVEAASSPDPQAIVKADEFLGANGSAEQARQSVIRDCMASAGFEWMETPVRQFHVEDLIHLKPLTLAQARTDGYVQKQQAQNNETGPTEAGAKEAFVGPPNAPRVSVDVLGMKPSVSSEGCLADSYRMVYGSIEKGMMATGVTTNALLPAVNAAIADPSVEDANKSWAKCMESAGRPNLATPDLAWKEARENPAAASEIAVTDAKCRESVSYENIRKAALNKYLTSFLTANEALITEIQEIRKLGAVKAQQILSGK